MYMLMKIFLIKQKDFEFKNVVASIVPTKPLDEKMYNWGELITLTTNHKTLCCLNSSNVII